MFLLGMFQHGLTKPSPYSPEMGPCTMLDAFRFSGWQAGFLYILGFQLKCYKPILNDKFQILHQTV